MLRKKTRVKLNLRKRVQRMREIISEHEKAQQTRSLFGRCNDQPVEKGDPIKENDKKKKRKEESDSKVGGAWRSGLGWPCLRRLGICAIGRGSIAFADARGQEGQELQRNSNSRPAPRETGGACSAADVRWKKKWDKHPHTHTHTHTKEEQKIRNDTRQNRRNTHRGGHPPPPHFFVGEKSNGEKKKPGQQWFLFYHEWPNPPLS